MASNPTGTRVSKSPGGASNLFNPPDQSNQPRKVRDHQKSSIFGTDQPDSVKTHAEPIDEDERNNFLSPRYLDNTKQRLFGEVESGASPRRINDTWRSNVVFSASADCLSDEVSKRTPRRSPSAGINPITGELLLAGSPGQQENGVTALANGFKNGIEAEENESAIDNGHKGENGHQPGDDGDMARKKVHSGRQPPGGKSSGIFG